MKIGNTTLIPQNIAPENARKVGIFDSNDNLVCEVDLGHLAMPDLGTKLYSVVELSDCHIGSAESQNDTDLANALIYAKNNEDVVFSSICGDLTKYGSTAEFEKCNTIIATNRGNKPVYLMGGNHDWWGKLYGGESSDFDPRTAIETHTGKPLYYTVEMGNDLFVYSGSIAVENDFSPENLQWLYETFEANLDKRIFLHIHCFLKGSQYCGDSTGIIDTVDTTGKNQTYKTVFLSLLSHYKNVILLHGHSHVMLQMQNYTQSLETPLPANYDFACGVHSIHIPSSSVPRDISSGSRVEKDGESQGYLMDVYEKHIVLRGVDFTKVGTANEFIPIAHYCLDTTLKTIEAGTFTDSTGTITV